MLTNEPLNAETRLERQQGPITPAGRHYVRSHFATPAPVEQIVVDGLCERPYALSIAELRSLPSRTVVVTLECAGNGRSFLEPPAPGEQWGLGAVGTAEWTGVPLATLLERAGPLAEVREVVLRGADRGTPAGRPHQIAFERSLPIGRAREDKALVAYAMNGAPLAPEHGAPARLVVPGRYGMESVKWLERITLVAESFQGFFQSERYVVEGRPLGPIEPRAVIVDPADGVVVPQGRIEVRGYAWCGREQVVAVEVSTDGGSGWQAANLEAPVSPEAWREWRCAVEAAPGEMTLLARAITASGERQPLDQRRNALGYLNNAARPVRVQVGAG